LGLTVTITTDDGSLGDHCLVTHPAEAALAAMDPELIYGCGPTPMLSCLQALAAKYDIPCQISIETMMACGMGACLGCAVQPRQPDQRGYLHACMHGPVFDAGAIELGSDSVFGP
jgi:dihydroorotate dehydrogenase electron transfer subunit